MAGDINAIGILIVPMATAFLIVKFGRLPKRPFVILTAIALPFVVAGVSTNLASSRALDLRERAPDTQCLIPCICLGLILMFVRPTWIRLCAAIVAIAAAFVLSHHYLHLVGTKDHTGDPDRVLLRYDHVARFWIRTVGEILSDAADNDTTPYRQGWLSESEIARLYLNGDGDLLTMTSYDVFRLWHTRITGLYRTKPKTLEIWYPGGPIKDALDRLEFRERPRAPHSRSRSERTPPQPRRAFKGPVIIAQGEALGGQIAAPNPALKGRFNDASPSLSICGISRCHLA